MPDDVSELIFHTELGGHSTAVHDNVFQLVIPTSDLSRIDSYALVAEDGSSTTERWPVPFASATVEPSP